MRHSRLQIYLLNWAFLEDQIVLFLPEYWIILVEGMKMSSIIQFNARDRGNVPGILSNWNWVHFSEFSTFVIFPDTIQARIGWSVFRKQMSLYKMNG